MDTNNVRHTLEHANLCLFRSRDTSQTLDYIINDLIAVNQEMSLEEIKNQLFLLSPAIKTLSNDLSSALNDVDKVMNQL